MQELYVHIHRLLDEHVAVHLATNYTDYTQLRVYEALTGGLLPIPAEDTHSLLPPSDPVDSLVQEHCRIKILEAWESLPTVKGAQELITRTIRAAQAVPFEQIKFLDTFCTFSPHFYYDLDAPVLAVRSIRLTRRIGHSGVTLSIPVHLGGVPKWCQMEFDENLGCNDVDVMTEDVIPSRLSTNFMSKEIVLRNTFSAPQRIGEEHSLSSAFRHRTPSPTFTFSSPQTPPLFSRSSAKPGKSAHFPLTTADLPLTTRVLSSDDNEGTPEYLAIADRWSISTTSSPPTSSLREHNEIFDPSSDSREPIGDLLEAKMDTVCMPRESRVGGFHGVLKAPGQHQRLHEYIGAIIDLTSVSASVSSPTDDIVTSLTAAHHVCATPTFSDIRQHSGDTEDNLSWPFSGNFLKEVIGSDFFDCLEETGLMDVPLLPAPNVHPRTLTWPSDIGSLLTHQNFSFFCAVKGIKSLNLELTWRPYSSEQAIPTLEELVGVSDFKHFRTNGCSDAEEEKTLLTEVLNLSHRLTLPISIEEEDQRRVNVILCATAESDSSTIDASMDGSDSNVLLTRAERCQSRSLRKPHVELDRGCTGQWDVGSCNTVTQSHISEKAIVSGVSECVCFREGTSHTQQNSVDADLSAKSYPRLSSSLGDAASSTGSGSAITQHVQLSARLASTLPPASLSQDSVLTTDLEKPWIPGPSWLHASEGHKVDRNYFPSCNASPPPRSTIHELGDYLTIRANKRLLGSNHDTPLTSPTFSEQQRVSSPQFDVEQLLWELTSLTKPAPPMQTPPFRNHRYLASVEILQDRPLMSALRHNWLRIDLLERERLNGADLVFDCDTALVFSPMHLLRSDSRPLKDRLSSLSWKYNRLAVVFKLYVYGGYEDLSARVIQSFKKFCRSIAIAEAYGEKRPQTDIQMYFARSDEQTATLARTLGDMAESQSQWGPWDDRLWLEADEQEEESYLASVDGMNAFAAAVILSQISLHDFLALSPDQRLQLALRIPVAEGMIDRFNEAIARRREDFSIYVGSEDGDSEMQGA